MITIYGIKNCDKCRAAQKWFSEHTDAFTFHDVREDGLNEKLLKTWQSKLDADELLNRRSQTWRKIPEEERAELTMTKVRKLALRYPTVIKRPIVMSQEDISIGNDESAWEKLL